MSSNYRSHKTKNLPLDEISIKLTDAILSDAVLDRDRLPIKIKSILSIWLHAQIKPIDYDKTKSAKPTTDIGMVKRALVKTSFESLFWRRKLREIKGEAEMNKLYNELDGLLIEQDLNFKPL